MQKRGLVLTFILLFIGITFINFVSAAFYYASSISDLLNSIDASTMILLLVFTISFALLNYSLSRSMFRDNKAISGVIAFAISIGIVYWVNSYGINRYGFNLENIFYDLSYGLGFSGDLLYTIIPLVLLLGTIYFIWEFGFSKTFSILGILLIMVSLTDLIYEKGIVLIIGIILVMVGFYFSDDKKSKKAKKGMKKMWKKLKKLDQS